MPFPRTGREEVRIENVLQLGQSSCKSRVGSPAGASFPAVESETAISEPLPLIRRLEVVAISY